MTAQRPIARRSVLAAGGALGAAGLLAACGGGSDDATTSATATDTTGAPSPGPTSTDPTASPTGDPTQAPANALAPVADIPVEGGQVFDGPKVVVTQPQEGVIKGFTAVCPHQGCLVNSVTANEIVCPCHGSRFSAETGDVIRGPAVQGLASANVGVTDGFVTLA
ncbi:MAG: Rieske (2Fe-2S) protein [Candidatus Nanopelagicales bacterium]